MAVEPAVVSLGRERGSGRTSSPKRKPPTRLSQCHFAPFRASSPHTPFHFSFSASQSSQVALQDFSQGLTLPSGSVPSRMSGDWPSWLLVAPYGDGLHTWTPAANHARSTSALSSHTQPSPVLYHCSTPLTGFPAMMRDALGGETREEVRMDACGSGARLRL